MLEADILLPVDNGSITESSFVDSARANGKRSHGVENDDVSTGSEGSKVKRIRKRSSTSRASSNGDDVPLSRLVSTGDITSTGERVSIAPGSSRVTARPVSSPLLLPVFRS